MGAYLAWRIHNPEQVAIHAIRAAGGKVHFGYQQPSTSSTFMSVGLMPENEYFSRVDVRVSGSANPQPLTMREVFLRPGSEHRVRVVEIRLDQFTPQIARHVARLHDLQLVVVEMPAGVLGASSPEIKQLDALRGQLPGRIYPSFRLRTW